MIQIGEIINFPKFNEKDEGFLDQTYQDAFNKMGEFINRLLDNKKLKLEEKHARLFALNVISAEILEGMENDDK